MIGELAEHIREGLGDKLNGLYNFRKEKEGLVSVTNTLIKEVEVLLDDWVEEKEAEEIRIDNLSFNDRTVTKGGK